MEMTVRTNVERVVVEGLVAGAMRTKAAPEAVVMEELGMKGMAVGAVLAVPSLVGLMYLSVYRTPSTRA